MVTHHQKLFRGEDGDIKPILTELEGFSYKENPLDFFILLARYKFAARLIKKNHHVLDAGCAHGLGSVFLSRFAEKVVGGDFDADHVAKNRVEYKDVPNLEFHQINLLDVSAHPHRYDALVSMDVIEHFTEADTEIVAQNYAALLKPDGFAVIGTPNVASQPYASERRLESHFFEFTPDQFTDLLQRHFRHVFLFSMTDEVVSLTFPKMAWYLMALCVK